MTSSAPKWVLAAPSLGVRTLKEFVALAKKQPNVLNYSSSGGGSFMHFSAAIFNDEVGIEAQHIPLKGPGGAERLSPDACNTRFRRLASAGLVRDGQPIALAVLGSKRPLTSLMCRPCRSRFPAPSRRPDCHLVPRKRRSQSSPLEETVAAR
jgi:tripartite-type tricarboxylate transporter receptor subunit TctC